MNRIAALLLTLIAAACAAPQASRQTSQPVTVGLIALNDFHGNLEEPGKDPALGVAAGGAARLASAIDALRGKYANSVTVSAGDLISASPITSSLFLDEPTVGAMNRIGLDFNAVGNHEFDRGRNELLRMHGGGCEKHTIRDPCQLERFTGAQFAFLAASTFTEDGETLFPATALRTFGTGATKVSIGFIGLTLKGTSGLVEASGIAGLTFGDEAAAINAQVPALKAQGADAIVVLIHQGGYATGAPDRNGCDGLSGDILPILARLDPRVDVVVSGHTHRAYVCERADLGDEGPMLLTSAGSYGRLVTDIALTIDPQADRVIAVEARNIVVGREDYTERSDIAQYVARYADAIKGQKIRPIGKLSAGAPRPQGGTGGPLGNLIADAHLAASRSAGAQIAFTNPFGIREALEPAADGTVTFGQIYAVQPFFNTLVTKTLTGAQIKAILEQGIVDPSKPQFLSPSSGLSYHFDMSRGPGARITSILFEGAPLDPEARYRVTTNSYLAGGQDGFTGFLDGSDPFTGGSDLDALEAWIASAPMRTLPTEDRVAYAGS